MGSLEKNELHEVLIDGWNSVGAGVAHIGGRAVFVSGAIPGERWIVRIVKATATTVYAKGERLLLAAPERIEPACPHFGKCGGCALCHVSYEAEKRFKLERVNEAYARIGGLALRCGEILGAEHIDGYRNKAVFAVGAGAVTGFFRPRSHDVVAVDRCLIQTDAANRAAAALREFMKKHGIPAYDYATGSGLIRHIFVRVGMSSGEAQVTAVTAGGLGAATSALADCLREAVPEAVSIVLNVNHTAGNTVLAGDFYTLWGRGTITDRLCGLDFELSPHSFYQVNPAQAERLYERALAYAAPEGKGTVLDLYCGAGTISLCLARGAEKVIGAEIVPEAVENARANARRNGIANAEFICADAGEAAAELARRGCTPDAIVLDPPRKGLTPEVITAAVAMHPERIVYISCDPATQARDLKLFTQNGYEPIEATAVDMFPRTRHVETVCLLSKLNTEHHIVVELSMDEMDLTTAEKKATYDEIKAYVLEHSGLKVSSLYIAQVKQKYGIIEQENYNKPKAEDAKQPKCPLEKERAIVEALRYFGMVKI